MNKKGFTLIELLAVILILGIIALIAIPAVTNVINDSKKDAAKTSAMSYIKAINDNNALYKLEPNKYTEITSDDVENIDANIKGKGPTSGTVTIENGKVVSAEFCITGYNATYNGKTVTIGTKCGESSSQGMYDTYNAGDLVYFDPVSTDVCDSTHTTSSTCYKWRVITVDDDNTKESITIQMDHNLVNKSLWSPSSGSNRNGPTVALTALETATSGWDRLAGITYSYDTSAATNNYKTLSCTSGACKIGSGEDFTTSLKARMITGEEIKALTMNAGAASGTLAANWTLASSENDDYYFSYTTKVLGTKTDGTGNTSLSWLVENIKEKANSGATANTYGDINSGYWTLSPVSTASHLAWEVNDYGKIGFFNVESNPHYGIRPVIELSKSLFN